MHADETGLGITTPVMHYLPPAPAVELFDGVVVEAGTENVLEVINTIGNLAMIRQ